MTACTSCFIPYLTQPSWELYSPPVYQLRELCSISLTGEGDNEGDHG